MDSRYFEAEKIAAGRTDRVQPPHRQSAGNRLSPNRPAIISALCLLPLPFLAILAGASVQQRPVTVQPAPCTMRVARSTCPGVDKTIRRTFPPNGPSGYSSGPRGVKSWRILPPGILRTSLMSSFLTPPLSPLFGVPSEPRPRRQWSGILKSIDGKSGSYRVWSGVS